MSVEKIAERTKNPRTTKKVAQARAKSSKARGNGVRVAIAVIGVIGSISVAFIKSYFDRIHVDQRLQNLSGIDVQVGQWGADYSDAGWSLGNPVDMSIPTTMRCYKIPVTFVHKFSQVPKIFITVSGIDIANDNEFHWQVEDNSVTEEGFVLTLVANEKFKVYALSGQWLAYQQ